MGRMRITREQALDIILRDSGETFKDRKAMTSMWN